MNDSRAVGAGLPPAFIHRVLARIARRWWLLPLGMATGLLLVGIYLRQAAFVYSAELKVYPAPSSSGSRPASPLGGLAALTGLAVGGAGEGVSPFRFYLDGIYSPEVAARLARDPVVMHTIFANEWDAGARAWHAPSSLSTTLRGLVAGVLGLPQFGWQAPDAARLQAYIADRVTVRQSVKTPIVALGHDFPDRAFARSFVVKLHRTVDDYLRAQQMARTRGNIAYLAGKLATVTLAEQRLALVASLSEQERQAMLAYGNAPYAADPFDTATVSDEPTRPRPWPLAVAAMLAGLIVGAVAALWAGRTPARHG